MQGEVTELPGEAKTVEPESSNVARRRSRKKLEPTVSILETPLTLEAGARADSQQGIL